MYTHCNVASLETNCSVMSSVVHVILVMFLLVIVETKKCVHAFVVFVTILKLLQTLLVCYLCFKPCKKV